MGFDFILPLRIAQAVLALAVLISASVFVSKDVTGVGEGPFIIFDSIFTFIILAYLVGAPLWAPAMHNVWVVLGVEALAWVLWLAGFAALAAQIPAYFCLSGSGQLCGAIAGAKAAVVLGAFEWLAFSGSLGLVIFSIIKQRQGDSMRPADGGESGVPQYNMQTPYPQDPAVPAQQQYPGEQQQYPGEQQQYPAQQQQQYPVQQQQYPVAQKE